MDHLEDFPVVSSVGNMPETKLTFYDRHIGVSEDLAFNYGSSDYNWRTIPKNDINNCLMPLTSSVSNFSTHSEPSHAAFPIHTICDVTASVENNSLADRSPHTMSEVGSTMVENSVTVNKNPSHTMHEAGVAVENDSTETRNVHSENQDREENLMTEVKKGEENETAEAPTIDNYFYEPLICLNTNPSDNSSATSECKEEKSVARSDCKGNNMSEHSEEEVSSVKSEKQDADFTDVESDEYSDDSDSDSEGDVPIRSPRKLISSSRLIKPETGEVYVRCSQNIGGKRCYGKVQYCIYCSINGKNYNGFTNLTKHILKFHHREPQVIKILEIPKRDPERKLLLEKVRNLGNYEHNMRVLRENKGEIIPWRCPPNLVSFKKYVPCKFCKGFFQKKDLWRHLRACPFNKDKDNDQPSRGCAKEAAMLLPTSCEASSAVLENVFMKMQADDITALVKNDKLITLYAEKLYSKHGSDDQCHMMISQKLREIGRLMIEIRKRNSAVDTLSKCLTSENYQVICEATRIIAGYDVITGKYKTPSLALKIGHALNKCCSIKQGVATESNNEVMEKEVQNFQATMNSSWTTEVSRNALKTLKEAKWTNPTVVPLAEDILRLQQYISSEMVNAEQQLCENPSKESWKYLCKLCLTSIVLLNRKRSGEISKMLLSAYINKGMSTATSQVVSALTSIEREMSKVFIRVEILGRDGRISPFIFTPFIVEKTDLLVNTRDSVGVNKDNKYLFAHPFEGAATHIRGHDCLREYSKKCGALQPFALTGSNLKNFMSASPY